MKLLKLTNIDGQIAQIRASMHALNEQIGEVQIRVSATEDNVVDADKITGLIKTVEMLESQVDYLENKSRQSNLMIYGVMEGEEGNDTTAFSRRLLPEILGRDIQGISPLQIERAHRVASRDSSRIRPIISKFGDYQQKMKVMNSARELGELSFKGKKVSIFPDFSVAVQKKRKLFAPVKKKLQAAGIRYEMHFPATLFIKDRDTKKSFKSPAEAQLFLDELEADWEESPMND